MNSHIPEEKKQETDKIVPTCYRLRFSAELPVYYSEWNENAIFSSYTNDTRKVAAYVVKTALDIEENVQGTSIWCFSDIFEEFSEMPEEFHGGFGLMTHSGIPKPQYYAMKMMAETCENRIDLGEGATDGEIGIAAFTDEKKTQILLFRQKMKNLELPKEKITVKMELEHAPGTVTLERIDEGHCNPLAKWEDMGSPEDLRLEELEKIMEETRMQKEAMEYHYEEGILTISAELSVNDVYFITIDK